MPHPTVINLLAAVVTIASSLCLAAPMDPQAPPKKETSEISPRVIGGEDAPKGKYPFMAMVTIVDEDIGAGVISKCGGSLISETFVLTTRQCIIISAETPENVWVLVGLHDISKPDEAQRVQAKAIHYTFPDLAVIELKDPVKNVTPVNLITREQAEQLAEGDMMTVIGFGNTEQGGPESPSPSDILQQAEFPLFNHAKCKASHGEALDDDDFVDETFLCAGDVNIGACHGDYGAPLMLERNGQYYQAGVMSFAGKPCATKDLPSVFVKVSEFHNWIYPFLTRVKYEDELDLSVLEIDQEAIHTLNFKNDGNNNFAVNKVEFGKTTNLASPQVTDNGCSEDIEPGKECDIKFKFVSSAVGPAELEMDVHTNHPLMRTLKIRANAVTAEKSDLDLGELLDINYPDLIEWHTAGEGNWQAQSSTTYVGDDAIETGPVDHLSNAALLGVIKNDRVTDLSFSYVVSSEGGVDGLRVLVNSSPEVFASGVGQMEFVHFALPLSEGKDDRVVFDYIKDDAVSGGEDKVYLDNLQLTIANKAPAITINAPKTVEMGKTAKLDASATKDPDGDTLSYSWKITDNPGGATFTNATNSIATLKPGQKAGKVEFELTVTDQYGEKSTKNGATIVQDEPRGGSISLSLLLLLALLAMVSCPRRKRA